MKRQFVSVGDPSEPEWLAYQLSEVGAQNPEGRWPIGEERAGVQECRPSLLFPAELSNLIPQFGVGKVSIRLRSPIAVALALLNVITEFAPFDDIHPEFLRNGLDPFDVAFLTHAAPGTQEGS